MRFLGLLGSKKSSISSDQKSKTKSGEDHRSLPKKEIITHPPFGIFTDSRDGKRYKTIKIGKQIWMAENLAFQRYFGCRYYNNDLSIGAEYGFLYDWNTSREACPPGWHIPTDAEWTALTDYLGGEGVAGGKMKEEGTTHWKSPNKGATNESGFSALASGSFVFLVGFLNIDKNAIFWSSSMTDYQEAWARELYSDLEGVSRFCFSWNGCLSVRCIKNN